MDCRIERDVFDEAYDAVSGGQYWFITLLPISLWGISMNDAFVRPEWTLHVRQTGLAGAVLFVAAGENSGQKPAYFWVWLLMLGLTVWAE